jgi:site-specific recombinase XerD
MENNKYLLSRILNKFSKYIKTLDLCESSIYTYNRLIKILIEEAEENNFKYFDESFRDFILSKETLYCKGYYKHIEIKALFNKVFEFIENGCVTLRAKHKIFNFPKKFQYIINEFIIDRELNGLSKSRLYFNKLCIERLTFFLISKGIISFNQLDKSTLVDYVLNYTYTRASTLKELCTILRIFFTYLYNNKIISTDLSLCIPSITLYSDDKIPSVYTLDEINAMLAAVDIANPQGKRDYAILILISKLGLRCSEIINLKFENINWNTNVITLFQPKTQKYLELPITNEIGDALINYMKIRQNTKLKFVFVTANKPIKQLYSSSIYTIMRKYLLIAGIKLVTGKKHGPHSLRFSLATSLLQQSVPIHVIKSILNHTSEDTTKLYIKLDISNLKNCALDYDFSKTVME